MKIRPPIFWFCATAIVLVALIIWFGKKRPTETPLVVSIQTNTTSSIAAILTSPANAPIHTNTPSAKPVADAIQTPLPSETERAIGILSTYNDVPIDFYGKLKDQFSNAVANAKINFSVRIFNGYEATVTNGQAVSDANGFFTIAGYRGQDLSVVPQKTGYVLVTASTLFKYSHLEDHPFVSDPNNPTIIKMWKLQGSEPLFSINQRYKFHYTKSPIDFDLLAGEIVPTGGDIQITVARSSGIISGRTRQDWGVQVEPVNGGLLESSGDEFIYQAPADGYQQSDQFIMSTNAPHRWFGGFDQTFFLQSRNGQVYSKVNFGISINQQPDGYIWVEFHGFANTNGSRNWEATAPQ